jgi:hypothetical protein
MMGTTQKGWNAVTGLFLVLACADPTIVDSVAPPDPTYTNCNTQKPCPAGFVCENQICQVASTQPDTTTPPPNNCFNVNYPCPAGYVCVAGQCAIVSPPTPDAGNPDAVAPPPQPDVTIPEDIPPPPANECDQPGNPSSCPEATETCRIDPNSGSFLCSGSTMAWPKNTPCSQHEDCDLLYGCHFGVCATYCEPIIGPTCCDALGETYKKVLPTQWGVCVP